MKRNLSFKGSFFMKGQDVQLNKADSKWFIERGFAEEKKVTREKPKEEKSAPKAETKGFRKRGV